MKENPLRKLQTFGQSIWLDYIRRHMIISGELRRLIEEDGLRGITSNPSIFEKAIAGSHDYNDVIRAMALEGKGGEEIYQALTVEDAQGAADLFRPIYEKSKGMDGFVSLEVNPHLAHDTRGTVEEARRLWAVLDRPNVFIKVPATQEGLPAIKQLISEGVNVNVTLLFGLGRYRKVAEAYSAGLEERAAHGQSIDRVASVASFFLSRIDVLVDPILEKRMQAGEPKAEIAENLHGQVAIASAKVAYQIFKEIFKGKGFRKLADRGAHVQRLLWASTSTKNPDYSDVKYVEPLIGPETINTLPQETLNAYRDHGNPVSRLEEGVEQAEEVLRRLAEVGIDIDEVTRQLEEEGVEKFKKPFDRLMEILEKARVAALGEPLDRQRLSLGQHERSVRERIAVLERERFPSRLWCKDPRLWRSEPEDQEVIRNALGWLHVAEKMEENSADLLGFVQEIRDAGFKYVVHMGMGGSSLAPQVFQRTFTQGEHGLPLAVLDTTDPVTILEVERRVILKETLFVVASKSGTTGEPLAFGDYFWTKVKAIKGNGAGENFAVITDPGTPLMKLAQERDFRRSFLNFPDVGGRFSVLSYFGLVPAALMGIDVEELLVRALRMLHACSSCVPAKENPGLALGALMGELASRGRDKVTFLMPEAIGFLGMWLEQLLAESTGKRGTGLLPVAGEPVGDPSRYGEDRLFVHFRLKDEIDEALERGVAALREAGHPVVTIQMDDPLDLGQEFFRWEIATATAGAILNINAFNQPNVQESKDNTNRLLAIVQEDGELCEDKPALVEGPISLYAKDRASTIVEALVRFLKQARPGNYVALLAYLTEEEATERMLQNIRLRLRDALHLATTLGYGPRYLHSTGQLHKGGSNMGFFLQLTSDEKEDVGVPGKPYSFGVFKRAQALGDLEALHRHGRRIMRVHLGADVGQGLAKLTRAVESALEGVKS